MVAQLAIIEATVEIIRIKIKRVQLEEEATQTEINATVVKVLDKDNL